MCSLGSAECFPQLHVFPPHSLFLIMFPRSMEPQLIMPLVCMSRRSRGSVEEASPLFSAILSRMQNKARCDVDYLLKLQNNVFHCDPSNTSQTDLKEVLCFLVLYHESGHMEMFSLPVK